MYNIALFLDNRQRRHYNGFWKVLSEISVIMGRIRHCFFYPSNLTEYDLIREITFTAYLLDKIHHHSNFITP